MTGKSQSEAVAVLRAIAPNSVVALIVSRQIVDDTEVLALSDTVNVLLVVACPLCFACLCYLSLPFVITRLAGSNPSFFFLSIQRKPGLMSI